MKTPKLVDVKMLINPTPPLGTHAELASFLWYDTSIPKAAKK